MKIRGLTLLEVVIALAILAVIASLALPSLAGLAERARLRSAAETLAADLAEARYESARQRRVLRVDLSPGAGWCWVVATDAGCRCDAVEACRLKVVSFNDHAGIEMLEGHSARFDPRGIPDGAGGALFQSAHGERLRVDLMAVGRARVCTPAGQVRGYPAC